MHTSRLINNVTDSSIAYGKNAEYSKAVEEIVRHVDNFLLFKRFIMLLGCTIENCISKHTEMACNCMSSRINGAKFTSVICTFMESKTPIIIWERVRQTEVCVVKQL